MWRGTISFRSIASIQLALAGFLAVPGARAFQNIPAPEGGYIYDLAATGSREFALAEDSLYFRNAGEKRWSPLQHPLLATSEAIRFVSLRSHGDLLLVELSNSATLLSRDEGRSWNPVDKGGPLHLGKHGLFFIDRWSEGAGFYGSRDTGRTWTAYMPGFVVQSLVDAGERLIATAGNDQDGGLYRIDPATGAHAKIGLPANFQAEAMRGNGRGGVLAAAAGNLWVYNEAGNRFDLAFVDDRCSWNSLAWDGADAYAYSAPVGDGPTCLAISGDSGKTWRVEESLPRWRERMPILPRGDHLLIAPVFTGPVRLDLITLRRTRDTEGIRQPAYLFDFWLEGNVIYSEFQGNTGIFRSRDLGVTWEHAWEAEVRVLEMENDLYIDPRTGKRLLRLTTAQGDTGSLPRLLSTEVGWFPSDLLDAGERIYAASLRTTGRPPITTSAIFWMRKGDTLWNRVPLPSCPGFGGWAAHGASLLGVCGDSLAYKADDGAAWIRPGATPFQKPAAVHFHGGRWLASTEKGLYQSADPREGWVPLLPSADSVQLVAAKGPRLLVRQGRERYRMSENLGLAWEDLAIPVSSTNPVRFKMSDSLLCLSGSDAFLCKALGPATLGLSRRRIRAAPSAPARAFDGGRVLFRDPRGPVPASPRTLDGRAVPAGARPTGARPRG